MTPVAATLWFEVELFSVVTSTYGFPKHDLTAPIAAADDLARRYRDGTARRLNADGSVDLAVMEGWVRRRFLLYRVRRDGEAALVQTTGAPVAYGLSVAMILGGAAVFAMGTVSRIVRGDAADGVMGLGILGFIVCFVGGIRSNRFGLDWYTRETFGSEAEWQQVFAPTKWAPRRRISCGRSSSLPTSTAARLSRLRAVEQLADEHGGKAFARPHPDGGTEVRTLKHGRLHTHLVAPDGTVSLLHRSKAAPLHVLGATAMAIGVGGAVVATVLHNLTDLAVEPAWYVSVGLVLGGATLRGVVTLESRGQRSSRRRVAPRPDEVGRHGLGRSGSRLVFDGGRSSGRP